METASFPGASLEAHTLIWGKNKKTHIPWGISLTPQSLEKIQNSSLKNRKKNPPCLLYYAPTIFNKLLVTEKKKKTKFPSKPKDSYIARKMKPN